MSEGGGERETLEDYCSGWCVYHWTGMTGESRNPGVKVVGVGRR